MELAAQHAAFGLHVAVTYGSVNATVETIDSGRASITFDTTFLGFIDDDTVAVNAQVTIPGTSTTIQAKYAWIVFTAFSLDKFSYLIDLIGSSARKTKTIYLARLLDYPMASK